MKGWSLDGFIIGIFFGLLGFLIGATFEGARFPWEALAAIGTLAAVAVALFLPVWSRKQRLKNIEILIQAEMTSNSKVLNQALRYLSPSWKNTDSSGSQLPCSPVDISAAEVKRMNFNIWTIHWAEYSLLNPDRYLKAKKQVETLSNLHQLAEKYQNDGLSKVIFTQQMHDRAMEEGTEN